MITLLFIQLIRLIFCIQSNLTSPEPFECVVDGCFETNIRYHAYTRHIREWHRGFYLRFNHPLADRLRNAAESDEVDPSDLTDNAMDYTNYPYNEFQMYEDYQEAEEPIQINAPVTEGQDEADDPNRSEIAWQFEARIENYKQKAAQLAISLKTDCKVSNEVADRIASNWSNFFLSCLTQEHNIGEWQASKWAEVAQVASSTNRQRSLLRLPIRFESISVPSERLTIKPYMYISIIDTLKELFKNNDACQFLKADYNGKFSILLLANNSPPFTNLPFFCF